MTSVDAPVSDAHPPLAAEHDAPRGLRSGLRGSARLLGGRSGRPPRSPKPPRPPRRAPRPPRPPVEYSRQDQLVRGALTIVSALLLAFVGNLMVFSHVQHFAAQQQLENSFRVQLAEGTAPVNEGDVDAVLLADGAPVAIIEIPALGVRKVVVEGTDAGTLKSGPGHRRDTVLPGQAGVSVIMARAAAYGGPFSRIQELLPGDVIRIITGQGEHTYEVAGLRYEGDPSPPALGAGEGRLLLETARGMSYAPTGVVRVDASLTSEVLPAGPRDTMYRTLPAADRELATDTSTVWALVFALQFLILVEIALVWSIRRIGLRRTWVVFVPVVFLSSLLVADQVSRLLHNLL